MINKNKGITLVALIVTIIILLILAGITISSLTGSGLFENAKLAEEKSKNAQEKEEETLADYENKIGQYVDGTREENANQSKVLFDGAQSSGTITFENDKIDDYNSFEFIFGINGISSANGRIFSETVSKEFLQLDCVSGCIRYINGASATNGVSISITSMSENSIEFYVSVNGDWKSYTGYIYKIIGRK